MRTKSAREEAFVDTLVVTTLFFLHKVFQSLIK